MRTTAPQVGSPTPWGPAETVEPREVEGGTVYLVSTPSHGGIYVPAEIVGRIPAHRQQYAERWSGSRLWYEEDVAALAVGLAWPQLFPNATAGDLATCADILDSLQASAPAPAVTTVDGAPYTIGDGD